MFTELMDFESHARDRFVAPPGPDRGQQIFGGQFLAQCLRAAFSTLDDARDVHSLHGYFLRPGDVDAALDIDVERVRDGRAFSSRAVSARQGERECFRLLASFQRDVSTPEFAGAQMPAVPPPTEVATSYADFNAQQGVPDPASSARPFDIRYINPPAERGVPITEPQLMWMRIQGPLGADPALHRAGLVYLSDSTLVDHVMLPHGLRWQDEDFMGASLDHAMWFHHPARADAWLLFEQTVAATGRGRGLVHGRFFDGEGRLVAHCAQEGLMRWRD